MISFPDKIVPLPKSVIGNMLIILEELNGTNLTLNLLSHKLNIVDMIDALICLYAIGKIDFKDHQLIVL